MGRYSSKIVEYFTHPRNSGKILDADIQAEVRNPVCGDQIQLFARLAEDRITECSFLAYGCAAAIGTASILTEVVTQRTIEELAAVQEAQVIDFVGGLQPSQRHCAELARAVLLSLVDAYRLRRPLGTLALSRSQ
jgi:nitrogen fixation NifU-like protein